MEEVEGEEENEGWGGTETNGEYTRVKTDEYLSLFLSGKLFHVHHLGPRQASDTVHRQERTLSGSLFLMAGWLEEEEEEKFQI